MSNKPIASVKLINATIPPHPLFGEVIHAVTRAQMVKDGFQVDVTETAREAGITFPFFISRQVWDKYVEIPQGVTCQDEKGRLWDIVWMTRFAMKKAKEGEQQARVALYVRNTNGAAKLVTLKAVCGPLDIDDPSPAVTVMDIDED